MHAKGYLNIHFGCIYYHDVFVCVLASVITSLLFFPMWMCLIRIIHFEIPEEPWLMLLIYLTVNLHSTLEMFDGLYVFALNESLFHLALIEKRMNPHVLESVLCLPLIP